MGETAEMMLEGILCQQCGTYIESESYGVPRYCSDCKPKNKSRMDKTKQGKPTTGRAALNGIINFVASKNKTLNGEQIIAQYALENKLPLSEDISKTAEKIQSDFGSFVTWFRKTYLNKKK
jgi:hypothetical protein